MQKSEGNRGFTLLELVLVMVVICAATAIAMPSLRGWSKGQRLRDAAAEFVATTQWARTQAVTTATVHRLEMGSSGDSYHVTVQEGEEFVPIKTGFGRTFTLPEGLRIERMSESGSAAGSTIEFYPTGRTQPARVRMQSDDGRAILIECPTPAETFRIVRDGGES